MFSFIRTEISKILTISGFALILLGAFPSYSYAATASIDYAAGEFTISGAMPGGAVVYAFDSNGNSIGSSASWVTVTGSGTYSLPSAFSGLSSGTYDFIIHETAVPGSSWLNMLNNNYCGTGKTFTQCKIYMLPSYCGQEFMQCGTFSVVSDFPAGTIYGSATSSDYMATSTFASNIYSPVINLSTSTYSQSTSTAVLVVNVVGSAANTAYFYGVNLGDTYFPFVYGKNRYGQVLDHDSSTGAIVLQSGLNYLYAPSVFKWTSNASYQFYDSCISSGSSGCNRFYSNTSGKLYMIQTDDSYDFVYDDLPNPSLSLFSPGVGSSSAVYKDWYYGLSFTDLTPNEPYPFTIHFWQPSSTISGTIDSVVVSSNPTGTLMVPGDDTFLYNPGRWRAYVSYNISGVNHSSTVIDFDVLTLDQVEQYTGIHYFIDGTTSTYASYTANAHYNSPVSSCSGDNWYEKAFCWLTSPRSLVSDTFVSYRDDLIKIPMFASIYTAYDLASSSLAIVKANSSNATSGAVLVLNFASTATPMRISAFSRSGLDSVSGNYWGTLYTYMQLLLYGGFVFYLARRSIDMVHHVTGQNV